MAAARVPQSQLETFVPQSPTAQHVPQQQAAVVAPSNPELRKTPVPRRSGKTRPPRVIDGGHSAAAHAGGVGEAVYTGFAARLSSVGRFVSSSPEAGGAPPPETNQ